MTHSIETAFRSPMSRGDLAALVRDIDTRGYACIPGYVPREDLDAMRSFVGKAVAGAGDRYVGFTGPSAVVGSTLDILASDPAFHRLMGGLYEAATGKPAPPPEFLQVLRCLTGKAAMEHSYRFHYDSYLVTALVPIEIPTSGLSGDLVMIPGTRPVRRSYARNVLDKLLLDNRVTQRFLRRLLLRGNHRFVRLRPEPGNLYLFWGYRSVHTNEPCDPDKVRATALFHYANPHAGKAWRAKGPAVH